MAYEFEKLSEVSALNEFPDNAKVLIEHEGEIKRCAGSLGGSVEIIELSYDGGSITGPTDRTPEELWELVKNGTILVISIEGTYENQTIKAQAIATDYFYVPVINDGNTSNIEEISFNQTAIFSHDLTTDEYIWEATF